MRPPVVETTNNHPPGLPLRPLLLLAVTAFATVTAELLPASLLLEISGDLRVSEAETGLLVAVWALTVAVASLPMVRLTRRVPRRVLVPVDLLVFAAATAVTALAPSYGVALAGRIVAAVAHGLFWSLLVPIAAAYAPPDKAGRAISIVLAGPAVASIVGIPLGAAVGAALGWRVSFVALALLLGAGAAAARAVGLPDAGAPPEEATVAGKDLRTVGLLAAAGGVVLTGHFALYTFVSPLLEQVGGFAAGTRAALLLAFGAAGVAGTLLAGALSDRYPMRAFTWVACAFAVTAGSLTLVGDGVLAALAVMMLWGLLIGLLPPVFQTRLLRSSPPGREATAGALGITVLNLGIAAGAFVGGRTVAGSGPQTLPYVAAAIIAVAGAGLAASGLRSGSGQPVP